MNLTSQDLQCIRSLSLCSPDLSSRLRIHYGPTRTLCLVLPDLRSSPTRWIRRWGNHFSLSTSFYLSSLVTLLFIFFVFKVWICRFNKLGCEQMAVHISLNWLPSWVEWFPFLCCYYLTATSMNVFFFSFIFFFQVLFAEPIVITACEFLEQNASSSSQVVPLVGYVMPVIGSILFSWFWMVCRLEANIHLILAKYNVYHIIIKNLLILVLRMA